jgi:hypothetical protein
MDELRFKAFKPINGNSSPEAEQKPDAEPVSRHADTPRFRLRKFIVEGRPNGAYKFPIKRLLGICYGGKHYYVDSLIVFVDPGVAVTVHCDTHGPCIEAREQHGEHFPISVLTLQERVAFKRAVGIWLTPKEWIDSFLLGLGLRRQTLSDVL